ncbi:MAG: TolC family protein, partial [Candidatus Neomarinimicrobiota bacterium]|nr:TolC family protein [Candidatus Neomarinimicrobiota bacterium]
MQRTIITLFLSLSVLFGQALSVDECVRIALENKAGVKRAEQDTKIAQLNRVSAVGMLLPTLRASNSFSETTYGNSSLSTNESYGAGISLSQNLFNSGNNARNVRQSNNNYLIAKENERQSKSRIIANVYTYYYQFLKNKELFTIAEKNLELSSRQLELVERRYNLGSVSKTDYLKASVQYGTAKSTLLSRRLNRDNSEQTLRNGMGILENNMELKVRDKVNIELIFPDFDEAYEIMIQNSPELRILDAQIETAQLNLRSAWGSSLPSLNLSVGMNAHSDEQITSEFFDDNYIKSANLTLSIPIFSGLKNRNSVEISKMRFGQSKMIYGSKRKDAKVNLSSLLNTLKNYEE